MNEKGQARKTLPLNLKSGRVEMNHGSGGLAMQQLIEQLFAAHFDNPILSIGGDFARLPHAGCFVMSTDGYVIAPRFFPGGNIGSLAVHGTINDIAMSGAQPLYLSVAFIIEEGLPLSELHEVVVSMAQAARDAGVQIVTGDTKVVERGKADGLFITTTGLGLLTGPALLGVSGLRAGQVILVSGSIGDHGVAVMAQRANLDFDTSIVSDSAALHGLVADMLQASNSIICLRDPTRGGLAAVINELADGSGLGMVLYEAALPIKAEVHGACELLGLDPLTVANEGKLLCVCEANAADAVLTAMRAHPLGKDAAIIGHVVAEHPRLVRLQTSLGGSRLVDWPLGELLPRIC